MAEQHILREIEYSAYGRVNPSSGTIEMYEAQFAARGEQGFKKWDTCLLCGHSFPKGEIKYVKNAPYCIKNKCYLDAPKAYEEVSMGVVNNK